MAINDLMRRPRAGKFEEPQLDLHFCAPGKVKALAVAARGAPSPGFPNLPTIAEREFRA